jgi:hypothetical protein
MGPNMYFKSRKGVLPGEKAIRFNLQKYMVKISAIFQKKISCRISIRRKRNFSLLSNSFTLKKIEQTIRFYT